MLPMIHWHFSKLPRDNVCWNHSWSYFYINGGFLNYIFGISRPRPPILSEEMVFDNKWQNFQRRSIEPSHLSPQVPFFSVNSWLGKMENSLVALWARLFLLMPSRVVELAVLVCVCMCMCEWKWIMHLVWIKWRRKKKTIQLGFWFPPMSHNIVFLCYKFSQEKNCKRIINYYFNFSQVWVVWV